MSSIPPWAAIAVCLVLGVLGSMILIAIAGFLLFLFWRKLRGKKNAITTPSVGAVPSILGPLFGSTSGNGFTLAQELGKVVFQAAQGHAQAAINTAAAQLLPTLAAHIPAIGQSAAAIGDAAASKLLTSAAAAASMFTPGGLTQAHAKFAAAQQLIKEAQGHLSAMGGASQHAPSG